MMQWFSPLAVLAVCLLAPQGVTGDEDSVPPRIAATDSSGAPARKAGGSTGRNWFPVRSRLGSAVESAH